LSLFLFQYSRQTCVLFLLFIFITHPSLTHIPTEFFQAQLSTKISSPHSSSVGCRSFYPGWLFVLLDHLSLFLFQYSRQSCVLFLLFIFITHPSLTHTPTELYSVHTSNSTSKTLFHPGITTDLQLLGTISEQASFHNLETLHTTFATTTSSSQTFSLTTTAYPPFFIFPIQYNFLSPRLAYQPLFRQHKLFKKLCIFFGLAGSPCVFISC
jgi:hypothetical protein